MAPPVSGAPVLEWRFFLDKFHTNRVDPTFGIVLSKTGAETDFTSKYVFGKHLAFKKIELVASHPCYFNVNKKTYANDCTQVLGITIILVYQMNNLMNYDKS